MTDLVSAPTDSSWLLRLFATAHTPSITDTLSTYVAIEASFPGYAPATIERTIGSNTWDSPGLNGGLIDPINTNSRASYGSKLSWSPNGSQAVYGHFWSAPNSNVAILAEQWATPLSVIPGSLISLRPNLELGGSRTSLAWRHVQSTGATTFATNSLSATFPGAVTEGNLIVVGLGNDTSGGTFTITDNFNGTPYSQAIVGGGSVATGTANIYWFIVPSQGGGYPFTVTFDCDNPSATTYPVISVDEYMFPTNTLVVVGQTGTGESFGTTAEISAGTTNILQQESDVNPRSALLLESLYRLKLELPPLLPAVGSSMCYSVVKAWGSEDQTIAPSPGFTTRYAIPWVGPPNYVNGWFSEDRVNAVGNLDTSVALNPASNWVLASAVFQSTGWYHVQSAGITNGISQGLEVSFPNTVGEGNLIVVAVGNDTLEQSGALVVKDNINQVPYQLAVSDINGALLMYWFIIPTGGGGNPFTIAVTSENPTLPSLCVNEYIMPLGYNATVDSIGWSFGNSAVPSLATPLSITGLDLICCAISTWHIEQQLVTPPVGFEQRHKHDWSPISNTNSLMFSDGINRNRDMTPSFTLSPSSNWVAASVAFKASIQSQQTTFMLVGLL